MASMHTPNYDLSQWQPGDAVLRTDFNQDFAAIDSALHTLSQSLALKASLSDTQKLSNTVTQLTSTVAGKADQSTVSALSAQIPKIVCGTYTGNGEYATEGDGNSQTIQLGFTPKAVLLMNEDGDMHDSVNSRHYGGLAYTGNDLQIEIGDEGYFKAITLTSSGFIVYARRVDQSSSVRSYISTNRSGYRYRYLAVG